MIFVLNTMISVVLIHALMAFFKTSPLQQQDSKSSIVAMMPAPIALCHAWPLQTRLNTVLMVTGSVRTNSNVSSRDMVWLLVTSYPTFVMGLNIAKMALMNISLNVLRLC